MVQEDKELLKCAGHTHHAIHTAVPMPLTCEPATGPDCSISATTPVVSRWNREIEEKTRTTLLGGSIDINDIYEEKDDVEFTEEVEEEEEEPEAPKEALAA